LALLASPLTGTLLTRLSTGPQRLVDLRRDCGSPAQTTLRAHLRELEALDATAKLRRSSFPGTLEYELTPQGAELLFVASAVERWLEEAPHGPLAFGSNEAKAAIKALIEGWSTTMLRALAASPLSLTELDGVISGLSYPSLERRLSTMRIAGQVEARPGEGNGTPYVVTEWLRHAIAPLAAAARWERRHLPTKTAAVTRADTEAAFLLTLPLLRLSSGVEGSCRLGVELRNGDDRRLSGATAYIADGKVASCTVRLVSNPDAWATGSAAGWLQAVVRSEVDGLQLGGDQRLARALIEGLHEALFRARSGKTSAAA